MNLDLDAFKSLTAEEKKNYLKNLVRGRESTSFDIDPKLEPELDPENEKKPFPLNKIQMAYLNGRYNTQDKTGCHFYHEFSVDHLDIERLKASFLLILNRHPTLRTRIQSDGYQRFLDLKELSYEIKVYPCLEKTESEKDEHLNKIRSLLSHRKYDLGEAPYFTIAISEFNQGRSIIHFSIDSWLIDGLGAKILFEEWFAAYSQEELPSKPSVSFRDYVLAYEQYKNSDLYRKSYEYWALALKKMKVGPMGAFSEAFKVDPNGIQINHDKKNQEKIISEKTVQERKRERLIFDFSKEDFGYLSQRAQSCSVSLTAYLLTIFLEFLSHFSTHSEFSILMTMINRPQWHRDLPRTIGAYTSTGLINHNFDAMSSLKLKAQTLQKNLLQHVSHASVSMLDVYSEQDHSSSNFSLPPIVFTSLLRENKESEKSWVQYLSYCVSQTPGIYLDHQLILLNGTVRVIWDVIPDAFYSNGLRDLFESYVAFLKLAVRENYIDQNSFEFNLAFRKKEFNLAAPEFIPTPFIPAQFIPTNLQKLYLASSHENLKISRNVCLAYEVFSSEQVPENLEKRVAFLLDKNPILKMGYQRSDFIPLDLLTQDVFEFLDFSEKNQDALDPYFSQLQKENFLPEGPLFKIRVIKKNPGCFYIYLIIDMLIADGLSTLLLAKYLLAHEPISELAHSENSVCTKAVFSFKTSKNTLKLSDIYHDFFYKNYLLNQAFKDQTPPENKSVNVTTVPGVKRYEIEFSRSALQQVADKLNLSLDAFILGALEESIAICFQSYKTPLLVVLCDRLKTLGLDSCEIGDFSVLGLMPLLSLSETLQVNLNQIHFYLNQMMLHSERDFFEVAREKYYPLPQTPFVYTSCLSSLDYILPDSIKSLPGCSYTPGSSLDCFAYFKNESEIGFHIDVKQEIFNSTVMKFFIEDFHERLFLFLDPSTFSQSFLKREGQRSYLWDRVFQHNQTWVNFNQSIGLYEILGPSFIRNKNKIGLVCEGREYTYETMARKIDWIAQSWLEHVKLEEPVGVCLPRNEYLIFAVLAILRLGACFVPIDIHSPRERLKKIIQTAKIQHVIVDETTESLFTEIPINFLRIGEVDSLGEYSEKYSEKYFDELNQRVKQVRPSGLAYIIFTSGSTGQPKGVKIAHRPVINLIEWIESYFKFDHTHHVFSVSPMTFDLIIFDIFGTLALGSCLYLSTDSERIDGRRMLKLMQSNAISFWNSAPAVIQQVIPFIENGAPLEAMRLIFLSGDWIPLDLPKKLKKIFPKAAIVSLGGATEATVWSNYYEIKEIDPAWRSIPYGRPMQNAFYYVLNERLMPCHFNEPGELYIGGECLADGYLDEALTRNKFIKNPFLDKGHLFKTGDAAVINSEGLIYLLGRLDKQVKVRGYRIELGELEHAIQQLGYEQVVALVHGEDDFSRKLYAFVQTLKNNFSSDDIKQALRSRLSAYMIPERVFQREKFPLTDNGKIDRKSLADQLQDMLSQDYLEERGASRSQPMASLISMDARIDFLFKAISVVVSKEIKIELCDETLGDLGFNSLSYTLLSAQIQEKIGIEIEPALFFQHNTPRKITHYLGFNLNEPLGLDKTSDHQSTHNPSTSAVNDIAVIGLWARLPGSKDYQSFWNNLVKGYDAVSEIPPTRWKWQDYFGDSKKEGLFSDSIHGAFIEDIDLFDARLFNISPREAKQMDPRQRILLEGAWSVLEDAGIDPLSTKGQEIAIYIGATGDEYLHHVVEKSPHLDPYALTGNSRTILPNRISYFFDWHGPSEVVDTACSSSLVAIHHAVRAIQSNEATMAIAGGINIMIDPLPHINLTKVGMLSPDGQCKAFSSEANGYVRGEGAALVCLKSLEQALMDQDTIHAVIKATGVSHGGKANSLTAPNPQKQAALLKRIYKKAGIKFSQIGMIEAHGTGTPLGDPIEFNALQQAFSDLDDHDHVSRENRCQVGSVKSNIGHLEAAAGVAGLIKLILSLKNKFIPPTLHATQINPAINLAASFFSIPNNGVGCPWLENPDKTPRVGGVSSFGFGGVYAHVVAQEHLGPVYFPRISELEKYYFNRGSYWLGDHASEKTSDFLWLKDHKIGEKILVPGMYFVGKVLEELKSSGHDCPIALENIEWRRPASLENEADLEALFINYDSDECRLINADKKLLARLNIIKSAVVYDTRSQKITLESPMIKQAELYALFQEQGVSFGPAFRLISEVSLKEQGLLSRFKFDGQKNLILLLDAALQSVASINLLNKSGDSAGKMMLPVSVKRIALFKFDLPNEGLIEVKKSNLTNAIHSYDVSIKTVEGVLIAELSQVGGAIPVGKSEPKETANTLQIYEATSKKINLSYGNKIPGCLVCISYPYESAEIYSNKNQAPIKNWPIDLAIKNMTAIDMVIVFYDSSSQLLDPTFEKLNALIQKIIKTNPLKIKLIMAGLIQEASAIPSGEIQIFSGYLNSLKKEARYEFVQSLMLDKNQKKKLISALLEGLQLPSFPTVMGLNLFLDKTEARAISYPLTPWSFKPNINQEHVPAILPSDVIVILGGTGGIGQSIKTILKNKYGCTVVLAGRHPEKLEKNKEIYSCDALSLSSLTELLDRVSNTHGPITGVINCVGINRDKFLIHQTEAEFKEVVSSKYLAGKNILKSVDTLNSLDSLKYLIHFSSLVSYQGNRGQSSYALANAFLNSFAIEASDTFASGCLYKTISINWPYWSDGGMKMPERMMDLYRKETGMEPMPSEAAVTAMINLLEQPNSPSVVYIAFGNKNIYQKYMEKLG